MGNLGSFGVALLAFVLLVPIREEQVEYSCAAGSPCPETVLRCYTLLGWENVLGPLGCSKPAAAGLAVAAGLTLRLVGRLRDRFAGQR